MVGFTASISQRLPLTFQYCKHNNYTSDKYFEGELANANLLHKFSTAHTLCSMSTSGPMDQRRILVISRHNCTANLEDMIETKTLRRQRDSKDMNSTFLSFTWSASVTIGDSAT